MLSIIVPIFNAEKYLKQCIDSVRMQTVSDFELILVNNDSEDGSKDICREYEKRDSRIVVLEERHKGCFYARKKGVEFARGEYITFIDADDFIDKKSYEYALEDMQNHIDVIAFDIYRYYKKDNIRYNRGWVGEEGILDQKAIKQIMFPKLIWDEGYHSCGLDPSLCNKIFKADIIKKVLASIDQLNFFYGEDAAVLYPLILNALSVSVHHKTYYYHRQREKSTLPPCVLDREVLRKLYLLYEHLTERMSPIRIFQKQIDLFYIHLVDSVKRKYVLPTSVKERLFPFDKVEKGENIIIYGAGNVGKLYVNQLDQLDYCNVVLWVDGNYLELEENIKSPDDILKAGFDKVVIAVANRHTRKEIYNYLLELGVQDQKIVY